MAIYFKKMKNSTDRLDRTPQLEHYLEFEVLIIQRK